MDELKRIAALYPSLVKTMSRLRDIMSEGMDLTYNQYKTLLTVYDQGPCSLGALSSALKVSASSASEMVERLAKAGLLRRASDGKDRRAVTVSLTKRGEGLLRRLQSSIVANYGQVLERLDGDRRRRLIKAIEDIIEIIGQERS